MLPLLLALVVFVIAGVGATAWLRRQPPAEHDLAKGLEYLAGLRWGDFTRLVLRAMHARGFATIGDDGKPTDGVTADGKDILLKRGTQLTLLSCKYGSASVVSAQAVLGLGKSAQLRGADATIVVTPGRFDPEARRVANQQQVELIDGEQLWPKVKPFIPEQLLPGNTTKSLNPNAPRMAWAGAAALGVVAWLLASNLQSTIETTPSETASTLPVASAAHTNARSPAAAASRAAEDVGQVPTDPVALEKRRREVASTIATLFGVARASWSTQSTLLVTLSSADADPVAELCPLLERYPELAASRVQLQPPADSDHPVRFIQCRSY